MYFHKAVTLQSSYLDRVYKSVNPYLNRSFHFCEVIAVIAQMCERLNFFFVGLLVLK